MFKATPCRFFAGSKEFSSHGKRGFTLVELLVVISILMLLMGILVPSLNISREKARIAVCQGHLRQIGIALGVYTNKWEGWLAGPNTSGTKLTRTNNAPDEGSATSPTQNMDWISPMMGDVLNLPRNRYARLAAIFNTELSCPSNRERYTGFYPDRTGWGNVEPEELRYSSYSAALGFHVYSTSRSRNMVNDNYIYSRVRVPSGYAPKSRSRNMVNDNYICSRVRVPGGYAPKIDKIGNPSGKVFAMDGARYVNGPESVTLNAFAKQIAGGNFMLYGPSTPLQGDPFVLNRDLSTNPQNLKYGWRHRGKFNTLFFDGHCECMTVEESLRTELYFPRGSKIVNATRTQDPDDQEGIIN